MGWWLGIAAVVVALGVVAYFAVRGLGGILGGGNDPGTNPTQNVCPKQVRTTESPGRAQ